MCSEACIELRRGLACLVRTTGGVVFHTHISHKFSNSQRNCLKQRTSKWLIWQSSIRCISIMAPHGFIHTPVVTKWSPAQGPPGVARGCPGIATFQPTHAGLKTAKSSPVGPYRGANLENLETLNGSPWLCTYSHCHKMITSQRPSVPEDRQGPLEKVG